MTLPEYLDVVDDTDRVIDQRTNADCHRLGLRHRTVHLEIYRDKNHQSILILQRRPAADEPGRWEIPDGHVRAGETYAAAAEREILEELGTVVPLQWQGKNENFSNNPHQFYNNREWVGIFQGEWNDEIKNLKLDPNEAVAARWIPVSEFYNLITAAPANFSSAARLWAKRYAHKFTSIPPPQSSAI